MKSGIPTIRHWFSHPLLQKYLTGSAWMLLTRVCWMLSSFCIGVLVARYLGPANFGIFSYATALVGMLSVITGMGIDSLVVRELIAKPERQNELLGGFACFRGGTALLLLCTVGAAVLFLHPGRLLSQMCLIITLGYLATPLDAAGCYFLARVQNKQVALAEITACAIHAVFRLSAVLLHAPLPTFAMAEACLVLGRSAMRGILYACCVGSPLHWEFRPRLAFSWLRPAVPLTLATVATILYMRTDILMLQHLRSEAEVGFYSIATRITDNLLVLAPMLGSVLCPAILAAKKISPDSYRKQLHRYYFLLCWGMGATAILCQLFLSPVLHWLYGPAYEESISILRLYLCSLPLSGIMAAFQWHAMAENHLKTIAAVFGTGAMLNIFLNALLIPRYGTIGAAASSVSGLLLGFILAMLCTVWGRRQLQAILAFLFIFPSLKLTYPQGK